MSDADYAESFDTDLFIEEIRNLPCLWDYRTDEFSNRVLKYKTWESLCKKFYEDFDNRGIKEKNQCASKLQRKWKSLRDSFNRDLKNQTTRKSSSKRYYYYNQLAFLKPLSEKRATTYSPRLQSKANNEEIDNEDAGSTESSDSESWKRSKIIPKKEDDAEYTLVKTQHLSTLSDRVAAPSQGPVDPFQYCDSDMHFLLSLYDRFKSIRDDLKVNAQIEILNVIQKYNTHM